MATLEDVRRLKEHARQRSAEIETQAKAAGLTMGPDGKWRSATDALGDMYGLQQSAQNLAESQVKTPLEVEKLTNEVGNIPFTNQKVQADAAKAKLDLEKAQREEMVPTSETARGESSVFGTVRDQIKELDRFRTDKGDLPGVGAGGQGSLASLLSNFGYEPGYGKAPEGIQVRAIVGNIQGTLAKLRGGTSFTPNEEKLLKSYTPNVNDSPQKIFNKITQLKKFIDNKELNTLKSSGAKVYEFKNVEQAERSNLPVGTPIWIGGRKAFIEED